MEKHKKPPIGVMNRTTYETFLNEDININGGMSLKHIKTARLNKVKGAILRYTSDKRIIPVEWVIEHNELLKYFGIKNIKFKL